MKIIKKTIKKLLQTIINNLFRFDTNMRLSNFFHEFLINKTKKVNFLDISLEFFVPNKLINYRIKTFKSKEPEILNWIDNFEKKSTFFDVGANIGLYSCYASKKLNCKTFSFEPSVFNLENLTKNIHINGLSDKITIIPNPLYKNKTISEMKMTTTDIGGAISTFAENYSFDGNEISPVLSYKLPGIGLDQIIDEFSLPYPDYLKIDVDGIEHLILQGADKTLVNLKSIFIEVSENFLEQKTIVENILKKNNFAFHSKYSDPEIKSEKFRNCYNQIWFKKSSK